MSRFLGKLAKDRYLASTLYDAIEDHDFRAVSYALVDKRADPNIILPNGIAPLHLALGMDDIGFALQVTKLIMQYGGNPNIKTDDGLTPLHIAAAWGRFELAQLLICCGADPENRDHCNATPIDYAVEHKHIDLARYLHYIAYCGCTFADLQDKPEFRLTLDKVIVNNGTTEAEYEVDKPLDLRLDQLPQASSVELVENWCTEHIDNTLNSQESCKSSKLSPDTRYVNCNPRNKQQNLSESISLEFECSSKFLSKRSITSSKGVQIPSAPNDYKFAEASQESGIAILTDSDIVVEPTIIIKKRSPDTSSDYFTCNEISGSINILEQNVMEDGGSFSDHKFPCHSDVTDPHSVANTAQVIEDQFESSERSNKDTRPSIVEVYKYTDEQEGITLYENRLVVNKKSNEDDDEYQSQSSKLTSLPSNFDYDTDTLRSKLRQHGYCPGPIIKSTKRVYLRKLYRIQRTQPYCVEQERAVSSKVYSKELEKTLDNSNWLQDLTVYKTLEETISKEFSNPDHTRRWREGINKSSFTYLLLDPRITNNLPLRRDSLSLQETWKTFVSSIFYVGKGKRSRPYAHLYEAVIHWNQSNTTHSNKKLDHIINIWKEDAGVVCLHVFQNVIPCEAYTREAAMIKALKVQNLKNKKMGDFYGTACTWTSQQKKMLGVFLLHKAMLIFLNEGERQLKPTDIN